MGCALNPERRRTELSSSHKAVMTGQEERERRQVSFQAYVLWSSLLLLILNCSRIKAAIWLRCSRIQQENCLQHEFDFQFDPQLSLRHQQAWLPASARMGCALNLERLRTELCSSHKAALTGHAELSDTRLLTKNDQLFRKISRIFQNVSGALKCVTCDFIQKH